MIYVSFILLDRNMSPYTFSIKSLCEDVLSFDNATLKFFSNEHPQHRFYEDLTKNIFELSSNIIKYAPYFFCWASQQRQNDVTFFKMPRVP